MKRYTGLLLIMLCVLLANQLHAQWIDCGEYKEIKPTDAGISQLMLPEDEDWFAVLDGKNVYRRFDYSANLLYNKQLPANSSGYKNQEYIICTGDGKGYITIKTERTCSPSSSALYHLKLVFREIVSDTLLFTDSIPSVIHDEDQRYDCSYSDIGCDYNMKKNIGYRHYLYEKFYYSINTNDRRVFGSSIVFNTPSDTTTLYNAGMTRFAHDPDYKYFVFNSYTYNENSSGEPDVFYGEEKKEFIMLNRLNNKINIISSEYEDFNDSRRNYSGLIPDNFILSSSANMFTALKDQTLYRYDFDSDKVYLKDTMQLGYTPTCCSYSPDDKFYIIGTPNNTIEIYHPESKSLIFSYKLLDSSNAASIARLYGTDYFLVTCTNESIKKIPWNFSNSSIKAHFAARQRKVKANSPVDFFSYSTGSPDSYFWDFGDGTTSNEVNPIHSYTKAGRYNVKLIAYKSNIADTLVKVEYVLVSNLRASFRADTLNGEAPFKVQFTNTTEQPYISSFWDFGDGQQSTEANPLHTYTFDRQFSVQLIVTDTIVYDTLSKDNYIKVNLPNAVSDQNAKNIEVNVYPNPADEYLNFEIENISSISCNITVYDVLGNMVFSAERYDTLIKIDLSHFATGMYYYKFLFGGSHSPKTGMFQVVK